MTLGARSLRLLVGIVSACFTAPFAAGAHNSSDGIKVVVFPSHAPVTSMVTQQFSATVTGTTNTAVTWYVDGREGGSKTVGTISPTGLYTPPVNFVITSHVVRAVSQADTNVHGIANLYLTGYSGLYTNKNDNNRSGQNLQETILTPTNVSVNTFGKIFSLPIDAPMFAQALYVANVNVPNPLNGPAGYHNVVYAVTQNDSVYAYDADGKVQGPLWYDSFISPPTVTPVPGACLDTTGQWGIVATPVIDPTTNTMYVEARTLENATGNCAGNFVHRMHALDITTGEEKFGGPTVIEASVPGTGVGSQNGTIYFDERWENSRPGLLLSQSAQDQNSVVYMAAGSIEDTEPYHGWVLGFDSQTLALKYTYNDTPDGEEGGIWQMGAGLSADVDGNLYLQTGNGSFDNLGDFGSSVLKLTQNNGDLIVADSFTPSNFQILTQHDWDISSAGLLLLPDQPGQYPHMMIGGGKDGNIYVMNRDDLGGYTAGQNNILQYIEGQIRPSVPNVRPFYGIWNTASIFQNNIYIFGEYDYPKMFTLTNGVLSTAPVSTGTFQMRGPAAIISANGDDNAIVWVLQNDTPAMRAFNPNDLTQEYYDTTQDATRDKVSGSPVSRANPTVANGRVYVPSNGYIQVYGLLQ
jgi:hypothetical protein